MRAVLLAVLLIAPAAPALAQPHGPACQRRENAEAMEREAWRARAAAVARGQRARTEATIRAMQDGELAGGASATGTTWRPPVVTELPPLSSGEPMAVPDLTGDAARMDALMAQAMARSTARVRAMTADIPRWTPPDFRASVPIDNRQ